MKSLYDLEVLEAMLHSESIMFVASNEEECNKMFKQRIEPIAELLGVKARISIGRESGS